MIIYYQKLSSEIIRGELPYVMVNWSENLLDFATEHSLFPSIG